MIMQLKQHLQSLKKGFDLIIEFVAKFKVSSNALAREVLSDKDMMLSLLNGVGHEYDSIVTLVSS